MEDLVFKSGRFKGKSFLCMHERIFSCYGIVVFIFIHSCIHPDTRLWASIFLSPGQVKTHLCIQQWCRCFKYWEPSGKKQSKGKQTINNKGLVPTVFTSQGTAKEMFSSGVHSCDHFSLAPLSSELEESSYSLLYPAPSSFFFFPNGS